jgi:hypothetical protein
MAGASPKTNFLFLSNCNSSLGNPSAPAEFRYEAVFAAKPPAADRHGGIPRAVDNNYKALITRKIGQIHRKTNEYRYSPEIISEW